MMLVPNSLQAYRSSSIFPSLGLLVPSRHSKVVGGETHTHIQQGELVSLVLFFQNNENRLKTSQSILLVLLSIWARTLRCHVRCFYREQGHKKAMEWTTGTPETSRNLYAFPRETVLPLRASLHYLLLCELHIWAHGHFVPVARQIQRSFPDTPRSLSEYFLTYIHHVI